MPRLNTTGDAVKQSNVVTTQYFPAEHLQSFLFDLYERASFYINKTVNCGREYVVDGITWTLDADVCIDDDGWVYVKSASISGYDDDENEYQATISDSFEGIIYDYLESSEEYAKMITEDTNDLYKSLANLY